MASVEMESKSKKKHDDDEVAAAAAANATTTKDEDSNNKEEEEKKKLPPGDTRDIVAQLKILFLESKVNVLLIFVPFSFITSGALQFTCCFFGLMPLAALLSDLVEDVARRTNDTISALLSVTFGNATELIVSIMALRTANLDLVKYSLVGSILGNSTLVLGSSIVMAGYKRKQVKFNDVATQVYTSGSALAIFALVVTSTLAMEEPASDTEEEKQSALLAVSRLISVLLIAIYCAYLYFTQGSHKHLFEGAAKLEDEVSPEDAEKKKKEEEKEKEDKKEDNKEGDDKKEGEDSKKEDADDDDDDDEPQFSMVFAIAGTALVTVVVSFLSEYLVESMQPFVDALNLSRAFVGVIVVALCGNIVEHGSALIVAAHGRMDLAIGIALGSSLQIAMMVYPLSVIIAMFMGVPLDLGIPMFLLATLSFSMFLVYMLTSGGSTTWLGGFKLVVIFFFMAIALLFAHDPKVRIAGVHPTKETTAAPKNDL